MLSGRRGLLRLRVRVRLLRSIVRLRRLLCSVVVVSTLAVVSLSYAAGPVNVVTTVSSLTLITTRSVACAALIVRAVPVVMIAMC